MFSLLFVFFSSSDDHRPSSDAVIVYASNDELSSVVFCICYGYPIAWLDELRAPRGGDRVCSLIALLQVGFTLWKSFKRDGWLRLI